MKSSWLDAFCSLLKYIMMMLALIMIGFPLSIVSGESTSEMQNDFEYIVNNAGHAVIIKYHGESAELVIPETLDGYAVEAVQSLGYNYLIESITLPNSVTVTTGEAFGLCAVLSEIRVSDDHPNLQSIDHVLFSKDGKTLITYPSELPGEEYNVPAGTEAIDESAFCDCPFLRKIDLPDGLKSIGDNAFALCSRLTELNIPVSVVSIGDMAFGNSGLIKLDLSQNSSLNIINDKLTYGCWQLSEIRLPATVESIGDEAFGFTALSSVMLPSGIQYVGLNPFRGCNQLKSVSFSGSNDRYAIQYPFLVDTEAGKAISCIECICGKLTIPSSIVNIGDYCCFEQYEMTGLTIPATVKRIGKSAFSNCIHLKTINIEAESLEILEDAFDGCDKLSSLTISGKMIHLGAGAFRKSDYLYYVRSDCEAVREYFSELNVQVFGTDEIVLLSPSIFIDSDKP